MTAPLPPAAAGNVTRTGVPTARRCGASRAVKARPPPSTVQSQEPMTAVERSRSTSTVLPPLRMAPPFKISALPTMPMPSESRSARCTPYTMYRSAPCMKLNAARRVWLPMVSFSRGRPVTVKLSAPVNRTRSQISSPAVYTSSSPRFFRKSMRDTVGASAAATARVKSSVAASPSVSVARSV